LIRNNTLYLNYDNGTKETIEIYVTLEYVSVSPVSETMLGG
jgi:hypothetical protein